MVEGAKMATNKFLQAQVLRGSSNADFLVASATNCSSIPGAQEGTFDLAICVYVLCNLLSNDEVKQALAEIYIMLKPGGKLFIYETHVIQYMQRDDKSIASLLYRRGTPKEDGTRWSYFEDEGKPREITMRMNSEREIKFTNRFYTVSSWVSWILEAGFQITQFMEPYVEPNAIPADAPDYAKFAAGKPLEMCWECTKPLSQLMMLAND
ncbi:hypothetical protein M758_5G077700 [Ceratodon purpureus]|nr:hypothetical protein M758_5G077700 [Ceratodon purpureus]